MPQALKWYREDLAVELAGADRAAKANPPENAAWQHNLSLSYSRVGDVLMAQGNLAEALKSYKKVWLLPAAWPSLTPEMLAGSAMCPFHTERSAM